MLDRSGRVAQESETPAPQSERCEQAVRVAATEKRQTPDQFGLAMQGQLRETQRDDFRFLKRRPDMHAAILVVVFFLQADIKRPILSVFHLKSGTPR